MMLRYRIAWIVLILIIWIAPAFAQDPLTIQVIGEPTFDRETKNVSVDVVIGSEPNLEVTDLTGANFDIGEPATNLRVTSEHRLPIAMAIIVDLSVGTDDDLIRDTLRSFFVNYYQPEDDVTMYILDGVQSEAFVVEIDSLETANATIDNLEQSEHFHYLTTTIRQALADLVAKGSSPVRPRVALHIGSLMSKPDDVTASIGFAREGIPFHVVQVHRLRPNQAQFFRRLAANGGGLFSNNEGGLFVLGDGSFQPVNTLKVLFDTIANMRLVYTLNYTSQNQTLSETQVVPVTLNLTDRLSAQTEFSYTRTFEPPEISFANIADLTVSRVPFRDDNAEIAYNTNTQSVAISVDYPDGVSRDLESLRLEIVNTATGNVIQSTLSSDVQPTVDDTYILTWNLDNFAIPSTTTEITVRVIAFDELGLTASTERSGQVIVAAAPPLPTATPLPTPIPTATPDVALTPFVAPSVDTATTSGTGQTATVDNPATNILIFAIFILVLVVLILLFRVLRFSRQGNQRMVYDADGMPVMMPRERDEIVPNNLDDMHTPLPEELDAMEAEDMEKEVLARLIVTEGFEDVGQRTIDITTPEFMIGRSADKDCDLVINVPYVSPRHCIIIIRDGHYVVRDLNSKNGTYVNDERVPQEVDMPAPVGSEISVTKSITMEIWDGDTVIDVSRFEQGGDGDDDSFDVSREADFQPLPGLKYVPDDGGPVGDDYQPI